jgi:hypothetical protein
MLDPSPHPALLCICLLAIYCTPPLKLYPCLETPVSPRAFFNKLCPKKVIAGLHSQISYSS